MTARLATGEVSSPPRLPIVVRTRHAPAKFVVSEVEAAAIRTAFERRGELSAAIELRRLFPGITDNRQAARERASRHSRVEAAGPASAQAAA